MNWFKRRKARKDAAIRLYEIAVVHSRDPVLYQRLGVADTIDGRFDLLTLYVILMMDRLSELGPEGRKLAQALFDQMFRMIDLTLREMGFGDMGIPKHMKKMMKAFNGRAHSYHEALQSGRNELLTVAISRNVYRIEGASVPAGAVVLADHAAQVHGAFKSATLETFSGGALSMPPLMTDRKETYVA